MSALLSDAEMSKDSKFQKSASEPFFSIGITTYERVEMLIQALNSILGQTFHDYEVIVSNDNPNRTLTGETLDIDDPRVIFINQTENLGEFHNMDYLLKTSRGRYFTWLADDDYYAPNFLQEVYKAIHTEGNEPPCVLTSFKVVYGKHIPSYNLEKQIKVEKVLVCDGAYDFTGLLEWPYQSDRHNGFLYKTISYERRRFKKTDKYADCHFQ